MEQAATQLVSTYLTRAKTAVMLTQKERSLIIALRRISFGKATVVMQDGQPDRVEEIRETFKL